MSEQFIHQTARAYDLPIEIVRNIYNMYGSDTMKFYGHLEEELKARRCMNHSEGTSNDHT